MTLRELGFPPYDGPATVSPPGSDCPDSTEVMSVYLADCHNKYCLDEIPTHFGNFVLREKLVFPSREFWVWSCEDGFGRTWDVLVVRGKAKVYGKLGSDLWMTGDLYTERHAPLELILAEYPEHTNEAGRAH